jgi:cysteine desulfurase
MASKPAFLYFDSHASTPVADAVLDAMLPYFKEHFGNPSSHLHPPGWLADAAVSKAREQVAACLGTTAREILFTSGATESNNLAILGVAEAYKDQGRHFITTKLEHKSVLDAFKELERRGATVTYLAPGADGLVTAEAVKAALRPDTILVSVMWANNEIGTIQPVEAIGRICKAASVLFHVDGVQGMGWLPTTVEAMGADLMSVSAHKIYGPKGVGALFVRRKDPRVELKGLFFGGSQERGLRPGTLNVPGIVGLGAASALVQSLRESDRSRVAVLRDGLWARLQKGAPGLILNGSATQRLPNNIGFRAPGLDPEAFFARVRDRIALSAASACLGTGGEGSHVLKSIGLSDAESSSSLRLGLGRDTTESQCAEAAEVLTLALNECRRTP